MTDFGSVTTSTKLTERPCEDALLGPEKSEGSAFWLNRVRIDCRRRDRVLERGGTSGRSCHFERSALAGSNGTNRSCL